MAENGESDHCQITNYPKYYTFTENNYSELRGSGMLGPYERGQWLLSELPWIFVVSENVRSAICNQCFRRYVVSGRNMLIWCLSDCTTHECHRDGNCWCVISVT